jgi:stage II sporulation protein D
MPDQGPLRFRVPATLPRRRPGVQRWARGRTWLGLLVVVGLLLSSLPFAPSVGAAEPAAVVAPDASPPEPIVFYGRGYGHGVGMSQYGARGRALVGQDAATILAHYYQGTTLGTTDPKRQVRVLVLQAFKPSTTKPLRLYGRGGSWTIDRIETKFPRDAQLRVSKVGAGFRLIVRNKAGDLLLDHRSTGSVRVRAGAAPGARIQVWSKPGTYDRYRGVIRLRSTKSGIDAINETQLDLYLRGVVPAEMPAGWPIEALKAQAIAARSYAGHRLHPKTGQWDLYDDSRTQVYRGSLGEKAAATAAITATAGQVVRSGTRIANTLFHSTGGGATEDNENVFTTAAGKIVAGPVSYLRGSTDRAADGTPYDAGAPRDSWQTAAYTLDQLSAVYGADARTNVGSIDGLDLSGIGVSGRLIRVTLHGSLGTKTVSGSVFRSVFNAQTPASDPYMWSTLVSTSPIP